MEARNLKVADLIRDLEFDRSTIYRWMDGNMPQPAQQERLAALFEIEPEALLRHPDDDWIARFFHGRSEEERQRIKQAMELAWPVNRKA